VKDSMAHYLLKARNIYTDLLKDSTLTEKQKENITYYGLLTVNIAAAEVASKKEDKDEAEQNIKTALEYFGDMPKKVVEEKKVIEEKKVVEDNKSKKNGGSRYTSGGKIFVFDESVDHILDKQQIALKVYPTRFKGTKLIKKLKDEFDISMAELLMMTLNEYLMHFVKENFSDIIKKGIKNNVALLAEKYHNIPHKQFKRSDWKKLNKLVYKSLESYPELPQEPTLDSVDKTHLNQAFKKVKKIKTAKDFYQNLHTFNVLAKKYYENYLLYLIECVKYLDSL
tara:strand:+ start:285 stop:1130 length:846 start_codon:yes stop_codon:yes gene_type:complete